MNRRDADSSIDHHTAAQLRYRVVLLCGHANEPPFTMSSYPPTTASVAKCEKCDRYVPVSVEVSRG